MGSQRAIQTLLSVFDLRIIDGSNLAELASARIVFVFDRNKSLKEFTIVDSNMPHELQDRLRAWLERNIDPGEIAEAMKSNRMTIEADRDTFGTVRLH